MFAKHLQGGGSNRPTRLPLRYAHECVHLWWILFFWSSYGEFHRDVWKTILLCLRFLEYKISDFFVLMIDIVSMYSVHCEFMNQISVQTWYLSGHEIQMCPFRRDVGPKCCFHVTPAHFCISWADQCQFCIETWFLHATTQHVTFIYLPKVSKN